MKRLKKIEPVFCQDIPEKLEQGKLYISKEHGTAVHLCACGCGNKTVTPIKPMWDDGWRLITDNGKITLRPSIGNFDFPCKSHYFITENHIDWL